MERPGAVRAPRGPHRRAAHPAVDALFRALHVTWIPMARRALYLAACPPDRAEALALWMLAKEPRNDWLAAMVTSDAVRAAIEKG